MSTTKAMELQQALDLIQSINKGLAQLLPKLRDEALRQELRQDLKDIDTTVWDLVDFTVDHEKG